MRNLPVLHKKKKKMEERIDITSHHTRTQSHTHLLGQHKVDKTRKCAEAISKKQADIVACVKHQALFSIVLSRAGSPVHDKLCASVRGRGFPGFLSETFNRRGRWWRERGMDADRDRETETESENQRRRGWK